MKQKIITASHLNDFEQRIQNWLDAGWQVVPQTTNIGITSVDSGESNFHSPITEERYVVFLSKD